MATLLLLLSLIALGLTRDAAPPQPPPTDGIGDLALYSRVVDRLRHGEGYYAAITGELRANSYPLRPFVAVRPPALSVAMAATSDGVIRLALAALAAVTFAAWAWRWRGLRGEPLRYTALLLLLGSGLAPALAPNAYPLHEVWAGLLIALSLALRRRNSWWLSLAIATLAALLRELAAPYLVVMAVLALKDGCRKEAAGWFGGLALFALALGWHALEVSSVVSAADPGSPPWLRFGGWSFVLQTASWNLMLAAAPAWLGAVLLPLALLGLSTLRSALGLRLALTVAGHTIGFLIVGRPNNFYWGLMIAPLWPLGLLQAWPALRRLGHELRVLPARRAATPMAAVGRADLIGK
ncbi:hypothetical protein HNR60_004306 [Rhodopseudomonas rhenobacensis]|uniref:HTTM domain-containing protein n=1 Tax=Rhodopseudomonas rhenobacensis TaxID=87461 RepID=A0A7W7Z7X9_9BRAD|nr:hypothetical protein [Rhodopseudomonas rhenobacensis]MBB5049528.1 hypothetical protein [Rhodopseudomonas rhenobacensis]